MARIVNSTSIRLVAFAYDVVMAVLALLMGLILRHGNLDALDNRGLFFAGLIPIALAASVSFLGHAYPPHELAARVYRRSDQHLPRGRPHRARLSADQFRDNSFDPARVGVDCVYPPCSS